MAKPRVWVCRKCHHADCLEAFLVGSGRTKVKRVGCQKVCKGPVAGVKVSGRFEWFKKVDRAKAMVALLRTAQGKKAGRPLPRSLEVRRVARHSGRAVR
jgi:(2Fe-2S) ferredoxin